MDLSRRPTGLVIRRTCSGALPNTALTCSDAVERVKRHRTRMTSLEDRAKALVEGLTCAGDCPWATLVYHCRPLLVARGSHDRLVRGGLPYVS
jgi:hypothetical protein